MRPRTGAKTGVWHGAVMALCVMLTPSLAVAESKTLDLTDFVGLDLSSAIKAVVVPGNTIGVVAVSSRSGDIADLRTSVEGGVLRAWYDWSIWHVFDFAGRDVTLQITMPEFDTAQLSSGASLVVNTVPGDDLKVGLSSNAHAAVMGGSAKRYVVSASSGASITVSGTCYSATFDASSGGTIDAKGLECADVTGNASSGAHITATATASVTAQASSGAAVSVLGHPSVTKVDSSSGGHVDFLN